MSCQVLIEKVEKTWLLIDFPIHLKGYSLGLKSFLCTDHWSSTSDLLNHVFMDVVISHH